MAKEYAKAFYHSKEWQDLRAWVLHRDLYTCADCGGRATEVHHETTLTASNINDPQIALNSKLLTSLCHDCHTKRTQAEPACDENYFFDENGQLSPRGE